MEVPLTVETKEINGKEKLSIWFNKKNAVVNAPINPYFYSNDDLKINCVRKTRVEKVRLSDFQKKSFYKYEFKTIKNLTHQRNIIEDMKGKNVVFEAHTTFLYRLRVDFPKLFKGYPHSDDLTFLFIDIEQWCPKEKLFPTYEDRIISISWATNDRKIKTIYLKKDTLSDKKLLELFIEQYKKINPDVIVCYNKTYDLPVIFERCRLNKIDVTQFSKNKTEPYLGGRHKVWIDGCVIYDIYDSTSADQSLTGNVPNKKLKIVSDYMGFKSTTLVIPGEQISDYIGTKELIMYNQEDVARLFFLFDVYWDEIVYKANDLGLPLSEAVNLNMSDLSLTMIGDLFREKNVLANGDNATRYPEIFLREKEKGEGNYQGALVLIKKRGLFSPVYKADYGSMYPSIMATFNLSPDVCTLIRYERYKKDGFQIKEFDEYYEYYIPDKNLKKTVVLQSLKREGFFTLVILKLLKEEAVNKKKYRETGKKLYNSRSNISKVKGNGGMYGNQGNPMHPYGFAPAAVGTCGIGRECAKLLIGVLEKLYPGCTIETDTDGVYFFGEGINAERILHYFNEALKEKFKRELMLNIDIDEYDSGYFHKMKNYILLKKGSIILHGVALKSSQQDNISKKVIHACADAKLHNKSTEQIARKYENLVVDDFDLKDFAIQVRLGRNTWEYTQRGKKHKSYEMAMRAYAKFNIKPKKGNLYHYVKILGGYELYQLAKKEDIDVSYYRKNVKKVLKMLESEYELFAPITEYMDDEVHEWENDFETSKQKDLETKNIEEFF